MFPFAAKKSPASLGIGSADSTALLARAPQLRDAAERVMAVLLKSLQKMAGSPTAVKAVLHDLALREMRDVVAGHATSSVASLIKCSAVPCDCLVTVDAMFLYGIVDLLSGGSGRELPPTPSRDATAIDQQFAHIAFTQLAGAIQSEWDAAGFNPATAVRLETLAADLFGARVREIGCVDFSISIFGIAGHIRIVLPPAALDRFASDENADQPELPTSDALWANQFRKEVASASIRLDAYLEGREIDLASLASLKVGQIITLPTESRSRAALVAQGHLLFRGEIGQAENRYTLRVADIVSDPKRMASVVPMQPTNKTELRKA